MTGRTLTLTAALLAVATTAAALLLPSGLHTAAPERPDSAGVAVDLAPLPQAGQPVRPGNRTALPSVEVPPDPAAVCGAFAAAMLTADVGAVAAYRRAAAYTTGQLAADLTAAPPHPARARGQQLAADGSPSRVEITSYAGEIPPDSTDLAHRAVVVNIHTTGNDTSPGTSARHIVYCTLVPVGPRSTVLMTRRVALPNKSLTVATRAGYTPQHVFGGSA